MAFLLVGFALFVAFLRAEREFVFVLAKTKTNSIVVTRGARIVVVATRTVGYAFFF